jgi:hypothetical protein
MTKDQLKEFCLLWGFDVEDDDHNLMPSSLLGKMSEDANQKFGPFFEEWIRDSTDTTDGFTYLCFDSWDESFYDWSDFEIEQKACHSD